MKYALIGCGRISTNHVKAVINNQLEFVAVCDVIPEHMENVLAKHDLQNDITIKRYTDYKKLLEENEIDLVGIATESGIHAEIALYCIEKGVNVIIEKPMAMSIASNIGIDLIWAEITNAYGAGEISSRLINTTIRKIINKENPQFTSGTQNYDFVYIDDVARAFYLIGKNGKPFHSYLIGSGNAKPLKEFLLEMKESIAKDVDFIFGDVPFTGVNLDLSVFDTKKTEKDTGFKAEISFAEGTKKTYEWLKVVEK